MNDKNNFFEGEKSQVNKDNDVVDMAPQKVHHYEESSDQTDNQKISTFEIQQPNNMKLLDQIIEKIGLNPHILSIYAVIALFLLADGGEMIVLSLLITKLGA